MVDVGALPYRLHGKRVFVAGHRGMVGSALVRRLQSENCTILTAGRDVLDLRRQAETEAWFATNKPDTVLLAAATVGGIMANATRPGEFIFDNLMIATNVIEAARQNAVSKLLFLGSSCIYPRLAPQPMAENVLLTGLLEPTNEAYAIAKIAGLKMCAAYRAQYGCDMISAQPTNLYGPGDFFDAQESHVVPALLLKMHLAKLRGEAEVKIWGTGTPRREFMHVDDLANALVHVLVHYSDTEHVNIGCGEDVSIDELARLVVKVVGYKGSLRYDSAKPDGTPRKLLDTTKLSKLGWRPSIKLEAGLEDAYRWFVDNRAAQFA